ncbi:MAG: isopenicillin N synthase family dioxygenase [Oligoflexales bacterium]
MTDTIPILDIEPLLIAKADERSLAHLTQKLSEAMRGIGFFYVANHGVPSDLQNRLMQSSRQFFTQPVAKKMAIAMKHAGKAWRGYFPVAGELTSGKPDQKEGIYFGSELSGQNEAVKRGTPMHGANLWPAGTEFAQFKNDVLAYMDCMTKLGQTLMAGIALSLGLPRHYFVQRFTTDPTTLFRIFNYPKHIWEQNADEWGVREHTDMGFLTILLQDESGGLQAKAKDGRWIEAPPIKDTFVINIGDMLEVWTRGIFRATPHRVRNQAPADRISLPFFFDPNWNASLKPIERELLPSQFIPASFGEDRLWDGVNLAKLRPDMTYGDFVWAKVRAVFPALSD